MAMRGAGAEPQTKVPTRLVGCVVALISVLYPTFATLVYPTGALIAANFLAADTLVGLVIADAMRYTWTLRAAAGRPPPVTAA